MKNSRLILRGVAIVFVAVLVIYAGGWAFVQIFGDDDRYLNSEKAAVVAPFTASGKYSIPNTEDYAMGLNAEGKPVFKDPHRAIRAFKNEHRLYFIKLGLRLGPVFFGPKNWKRFQQAFWTASPRVWGEVEGDHQLYDFLSVYSNSFNNFI